ncbi:MAG TPA: NADH:flavin oxidoreductase/NADH oxidase [Steroidobacteraceae bacterium]|nr:NADH:flavin oxidoreductase/NADH oxidase [Steroidobacteraceae bacterium]
MSSALFTPIKLRELELSNRLVVAPMCQYSASDGTVGEWHVQHLSQLGYSGAGLVVVEATAVERRGRITHGCVGLYNDDNEAALEHVLQVARRFAGPTKFGIQLAHAGRKASARRPWEGGAPLTAKEDAWQTIAPSAVPFADGWHTPHALSVDEIEQLIAAWTTAAQRAVRIGFDMIELHCAHGYLNHEFLSPIANKRTDQYGGSLDNRMRLPLAIIRAVRAVMPASMPLGMRVSATDWVEGGWDIKQTCEFARATKELGVDFVCASSGAMVSSATVPIGPGFQVPLAAAIKRATSITTRAVGLINSAQQAEKILQEGSADMIAIARGFLDDPRFGWHAADALGATTHGPSQYALARSAGWRKFRDTSRQLTIGEQ